MRATSLTVAALAAALPLTACDDGGDGGGAQGQPKAGSGLRSGVGPASSGPPTPPPPPGTPARCPSPSPTAAPPVHPGPAPRRRLLTRAHGDRRRARTRPPGAEDEAREGRLHVLHPLLRPGRGGRRQGPRRAPGVTLPGAASRTASRGRTAGRAEERRTDAGRLGERVPAVRRLTPFPSVQRSAAAAAVPDLGPVRRLRALRPPGLVADAAQPGGGRLAGTCCPRGR